MWEDEKEKSAKKGKLAKGADSDSDSDSDDENTAKKSAKKSDAKDNGKKKEVAKGNNNQTPPVCFFFKFVGRS